MANKLSTKYSPDVLVSAIIMFVFMKPYFLWGDIWQSIYMKFFLAVVLGVIFYRHRLGNTQRWIGLQFYFILCLLMFTLFGRHNMNFFFALAPVVLIPFAKQEFNHDVYTVFVTIVVFFLGLSLLSYLAVLVGVFHPIRTIPPLNGLKDINYSVYPLFLLSPSGAPVVRFFGPFDEPGVVGTYCAILLCIEKFRISGIKNLILLVSGLISLSLFFYVIVALYLAFYYAYSKRSILKSLAFIALSAMIFTVITTNPYLYDHIGSRFAFDSDTGRLAGDNRFDAAKQTFYLADLVQSNRLWLGYDNKAILSDDIAGSSSYVVIIIYYGLLAALLYLLFFVFYGIKFKRDWVSFALYLVVCYGTMYQRPNVFEPLMIFLFVYLVRDSKTESKKGIVIKPASGDDLPINHFLNNN